MGNPNDRPVGSPQAVSAGFLNDLAEGWQEHGRGSEELSEKLQINQDQYENYVSKAKLQWESKRPSDIVLAIAVLVIDLVTIALGWLIGVGLHRPWPFGASRVEKP